MGRLAAALAVFALATAGVQGTFSAFTSQVSNDFSATSKSTFAPTAGGLPVVSGTIALGQQLSATAATWGNTQYVSPTISRRWQYCPGAVVEDCVDLPGTGSTYVINLLDINTALGTVFALLPGDAHFRIVETATNTWGSTIQAAAIL
jgi:hypothetical protein